MPNPFSTEIQILIQIKLKKERESGLENSIDRESQSLQKEKEKVKKLFQIGFPPLEQGEELEEAGNKIGIASCSRGK